jgi:hypothetical protein
MKKYFPLILLLLVSINSFSQTVTLDSITAKKVIVDLIEGDFCKVEVKELRLILADTELKVIVKDKIIGIKDEKINALQLIIKNDLQIIKTQNRKTTFYKITTIAAILTGGYFALK